MIEVRIRRKCALERCVTVIETNPAEDIYVVLMPDVQEDLFYCCFKHMKEDLMEMPNDRNTFCFS